MGSILRTGSVAAGLLVALGCSSSADSGSKSGAGGTTQQGGASSGGSAGVGGSAPGGQGGSSASGGSGAGGSGGSAGSAGSGGTGTGGTSTGGVPGTFITPDDPGPADVSFTISSEARRGISVYVYGTNQPDWSGRGSHLTASRFGGNRTTAYNWENNASNAGSDYQHQNDSFLGGGDTPGEVVRLRAQAAHDVGASLLVTVPAVGYVSADKNGGGDVNQSPNYLSTRFHVSEASKGGSLSMTPNLGDGRVYQDEFVNWLESTFPGARNDPARTLWYCIDNEPDLWSDTHPRIHPEPVGYAELAGKNVEYARAIKSIAPAALVFGSVNYGWAGYADLQSAPDAAGRDYLDFYLAEMAAAEQTHGQRLIDVLDLHWYPEAQGGGQRITNDNTDAAVAAARVQAPRSLWDDSYTEDSWIAEWGTLGPVRLLPRLEDKIAAAYPGTRIAITEYNYGGGNHISGGIAQADVLGIFGRDQVFAAFYWSLSGNDDYVWGAFDMFRNYDGNGGSFGDTSLAASSDDIAATSVYASLDAANPERVVVVAINKTASPQSAGVAITHTNRFSSAEVYVLTDSGSAPVRGADLPISAVNAFVYPMPAMSVSTLVLE